MPVNILYPLDYLPTPNAAQSRLIDKFVEGLESALQVSKEDISLAGLWKEDCPDGPEHTDIAEYLKLVFFWFVSHVRLLLSSIRLAAILTTGMHTTTCLASESNTRRSMESHPSYTELCIGSGEWTVFAIW